MEPNGHTVSPSTNEEMDEFVGQRICPTVPINEGTWTHGHESIVLTQSDGSGGLNLLDG